MSASVVRHVRQGVQRAVGALRSSLRRGIAAVLWPVLVSGGVVITPLHPSPGSFVLPADFLVVASFDSDALPSGASAVVFLDGVERGRTTADAGVIIWTPPDDMRASAEFAGAHRIELRVLGDDTTVVAGAEWSFTILAQRGASDDDSAARAGNEFRQNGMVYAQVGQVMLDGVNVWEAALGGTYRASYGKLRYGAEISVANQNEPYSQDRNTYRADISYGRWLTLRVGDTRPSYDPAIISGKRIRGIELNARGILASGLNLVQLDVAYGQALRSARPDVYDRNLLATRLTFGSGSAFQFAVSFLRGADTPGSIRPLSDTTVFVDTTAGIYDTTVSAGATPEQNAVVGADFITRLFGGRAEVFASYAFSLFTRNIADSAVTKEQLDTMLGVSAIDPESFNWLIMLNQSSLPLSGGMGVLNSSYMSAGARFHLPARAFSETFEVRWKLHGANYYSMGSPLLGTGEQSFSFVNKTLLLNNRLQADLSYERAWNNIDGFQSQGTVANRVGAGVAFFYSVRAPSVNVQYRYTGSTNADTLYGFSSGVNGLNVIGAYRYRLAALSGTFTLYAAWSGLSNSFNIVSFADSISARDTSTYLSTGTYGLAITAQAEGLPLEFSGGLNTNAGDERLLRMVNGSLETRWRLWQRRLVLSLGFRLGASQMPGHSSYSFHTRVPYGAAYTYRSHSARLGGYVTVDGGTTDLVNTIRYEWRF